ncbi:hypothetical protein MCOR25_010589 [Pyricularia grisea]|nr:hypothetical protein MCOR25_010589 [Pyricularia grisea]
MPLLRVRRKGPPSPRTAIWLISAPGILASYQLRCRRATPQVGWVAAREFLSRGKDAQSGVNVTNQSPLEHMASHCAEAMNQQTL